MKQPSLLFLAHLLPYPPDSGAAIRTYNTIKQLSQAFELTVLCFHRDGTNADSVQISARLAAMKDIADVTAFPIRQQGRPWRLAWDHIRSIATRLPYTHYMHDSAEYERALLQALRRDSFDLVHLDSLDLVRFLPLLPDGPPKVCTHHNVESALLRRRAELRNTPGPVRAYLRLQSRLLAREEARWLPRMDLNIVVSRDDADQLHDLAPESRIEVVSNGVDTGYFQPESVQISSDCVFVGGTNWFPNRDGLEWFATQVTPVLGQRSAGTETVWVGHVSAREREVYREVPGLNFTGYVDDIRTFVHPAACFVVPLRVGGGTRLKVLDAWAMGKAVVSTSLGCEGLATVPGENILIADDADQFAEAILRVLHDTELRQRLGASGRRTAEERYSWSSLGMDLRRLYSGLLSTA